MKIFSLFNNFGFSTFSTRFFYIQERANVVLKMCILYLFYFIFIKSGIYPNYDLTTGSLILSSIIPVVADISAISIHKNDKSYKTFIVRDCFNYDTYALSHKPLLHITLEIFWLSLWKHQNMYNYEGDRKLIIYVECTETGRFYPLHDAVLIGGADSYEEYFAAVYPEVRDKLLVHLGASFHPNIYAVVYPANTESGGFHGFINKIKYILPHLLLISLWFWFDSDLLTSFGFFTKFQPLKVGFFTNLKNIIKSGSGNYFNRFFNRKDPKIKLWKEYSPKCRVYILDGFKLVPDNPIASLRLVYKAMLNSEEFMSFGEKKIIMIKAYSEEKEHYVCFHPNIMFTPTMSFSRYLAKVYTYVRNKFYKYDEDTYTKFIIYTVDASNLENQIVQHVRVECVEDNFVYYSTRLKVQKKRVLYKTLQNDSSNKKNIFKVQRRGYSTSMVNHSSRSIGKLKRVPVNLKDIATVDIETIIMDPVTRVHIPIAISTVSKDFNKLFIIDRELLEIDPQKAVNNLFKEYLDFMMDLKKEYIIYAHNLGHYDGYLLYKNLLNIVNSIYIVKPLIDGENKFISIEISYKYLGPKMKTAKKITLTWKDSLRLFPGSLESLCKQFNVAGKISKYDMAFNNISLFDNPELLERFKEYSLQDSIALYDALMSAQKLYFDNYKVDICSTYSTASLAFKIYRSNFITKEIPLLTPDEDRFIRRAYSGGATDYYKACGEELYWYDVNSLYPYAMMGELPYKIVKKHKDLSGVNVKDFKGFVKARVTCPDNIKHPIVAYHTEGKTVYPTGTWEDVYFSDLLAKAQTFGYKIELIEGIEFEYTDLFSDYIKHFYEIKKNSKGSLKYLAKLKLNSLYGTFGRKKETLTAINVENKDLHEYFLLHNIQNIIHINENVSVLICENIIHDDVLDEFNMGLETNIRSEESRTLTNVAIAAAITARAQMIMMDYKNNPDFDVYYTDTDSIFTDKPLPSQLVGDALGQMKNESLDKWGVEKIDKACFVGIKKYGLSVKDCSGNLQQLSVFSGVPRNSLTYDEVLQVQSGKIIERTVTDRFVKSFENLEIKTQQPLTLHISNNRDKRLEGNNYLPVNCNNFSLITKNQIINKYINRFNYLKRKYL